MSETRTSWLAIGLVGAVLLLGVALGQLGYLQPARNTARVLVAPFQAGLATMAGDVGDLLHSASDLRDLRQRNAQLESEVNGLSVENVRLTEVERENAEVDPAHRVSG